MSTHLPGHFRTRVGARRHQLVLASATSRARTEVLFHGVTVHDLPEQLQDPVIEKIPAGAGGSRHTFAVRSEKGAWRVEAAGVQIHEHLAIFGHEVTLPRFALRRRVAWTLLLWLARFRWGRTAIEWLAARR